MQVKIKLSMLYLAEEVLAMDADTIRHHPIPYYWPTLETGISEKKKKEVMATHDMGNSDAPRHVL